MTQEEIHAALRENFARFVQLRKDQNKTIAQLLRACQRQLSKPNADREERTALLAVLPETIALLEGADA